MLKFIIMLNLCFGVVTQALAQGAADPNEAKVREEDDWTKQANFLSSKEGKVNEFRVKIESLIKQKRKVTTDDEEKEIVKELILAHADFSKAVNDYNSLYNKLKYRFPDKSGKPQKRKYLPMRLHSLEQIENEMGIDADLTRIRKKINKKYAPYLEDELRAKQESGPLFYKGQLNKQVEEEQRIRLEK